MPLLGPSRPDFRSQGVRSKVTTRQCKKYLSLTTPFWITHLRTLTDRVAAILDFHMQTFHRCTLSKRTNAADPQDGPAAQAPSSVSGAREAHGCFGATIIALARPGVRVSFG